MATIIERDIEPKGGSVYATVCITSKDPHDVYLAGKYGDIYISPSGEFTDPEDNTFKFNVFAGLPVGVLLSILPDQRISASFLDPGISVATKLRQANLWTLAIANSIAVKLTSLRTNQDSISGNYTMTV